MPLTRTIPALIALLVGASVLLPMAVGLAVVGPLLAHASWHAYRDSVRWPVNAEPLKHRAINSNSNSNSNERNL